MKEAARDSRARVLNVASLCRVIGCARPAHVTGRATLPSARRAASSLLLATSQVIMNRPSNLDPEPPLAVGPAVGTVVPDHGALPLTAVVLF